MRFFDLARTMSFKKNSGSGNPRFWCLVQGKKWFLCRFRRSGLFYLPTVQITTSCGWKNLAPFVTHESNWHIIHINLYRISSINSIIISYHRTNVWNLTELQRGAALKWCYSFGVITTSMSRVDVHGIPCSSMTGLWLKKDEKRTAAFRFVSSEQNLILLLMEEILNYSWYGRNLSIFPHRISSINIGKPTSHFLRRFNLVPRSLQVAKIQIVEIPSEWNSSPPPPMRHTKANGGRNGPDPSAEQADALAPGEENCVTWCHFGMRRPEQMSMRE